MATLIPDCWRLTVRPRPAVGFQLTEQVFSNIDFYMRMLSAPEYEILGNDPIEIAIKYENNKASMREKDWLVREGTNLVLYSNNEFPHYVDKIAPLYVEEEK